MMTTHLALIAALLAAAPLAAQTAPPSPSGHDHAAPAAAASRAAQRRQEPAQRETASALINGRTVAVEYGRPALGGRKMADLLGQLPADRIWRAMWPRLDGYENVKATEVLRVPLRKGVATEPMDRFNIGFAPARDGVSSITLTWGGESWTPDVRAASPSR